MLRDRIITALIALPLIVVLTLYVSTGVFFAVTLVIVTLAVLEALHVFRPQVDMPLKGLVVTGGLGIYTVICWYPALFAQVFSILFLLLGIFYLFRFKDIVLVINDCAVVLLVWAYVPVLFSYIVLLHAIPNGHELVFMVLLMTMVCDSTAYFSGTYWGRHRLYPAVSPKKSIEGALGGICGSVIAALVSKWIYVPEFSVVTVLGFGVVIGVFAQVGDLFESLLKRSARIKDSGQLFPGHGGMLDRLDSLLFAFPIAYLYVKLVL